MRDTEDMVVLINLDSDISRAMARLMRSAGIYCRILPAEVKADSEVLQAAAGVLLCGTATGQPCPLPQLPLLLQLGKPLLALGDAALTLCEVSGGALGNPQTLAEACQVRFDEADDLVGGLAPSERWLPTLRPLLPCGVLTPVAFAGDTVLGIKLPDRPVYGFAFQVECNDPDGIDLLRRFVGLCGCELWWSTEAFIRRACDSLSEMADGGEAVCAVSGGVDSAVCALLAHQALGEKLHCVLVDTGLLRQGEVDGAAAALTALGLQVKQVDASADILAALQGVTDKAEKERVIFSHLRAILRREVFQLDNPRLILQGTNYSDSLASEPPFPLEAQGVRVRIAEPVRDLFKDEIRHVAEDLGLPQALCQRQPFPGAGLALRMDGEVTAEKLSLLRQADALFRQEIEAAGLQKKLWQYYAALSTVPGAPDRLWVMLRAVQAMSTGAVAARLPGDLLERAADAIAALSPAVERVLYDLSKSKTYRRVM